MLDRRPRSHLGSSSGLKLRMARAKCAITDELCGLMVKTHLDPGKVGQVFGCLDDEDFTEEFGGFLAAVAKHTTRVSGSVVAKSVKAVLGTPRADAEKFGHCVSSALSWRHTKGLQATSGKKLKEATVSVIVAFADERLKAVQDAIKSGKDLPAKRQSPSSFSSSEKRQKGPATATEPVAATPARASADSDVALTADSIAALYGLSPPRKTRASSATPQVLVNSPISVAGSAFSVASSTAALVETPQKPPKEEARKADLQEIWHDLNARTAHRFQDGVQQDGLLKAGPSGFCIASFADDEDGVVTEVPNLLLEKSVQGATVKRKPAAKKKPAAAAEREDEAEPGGDEQGQLEEEQEENEEKEDETPEQPSKEEAALAGAAVSVPTEVGGRVVYMNATITRFEKLLKIHIPRKHSIGGKECDVQLMYGKTKTLEEAFSTAKMYIEKRAKSV